MCNFIEKRCFNETPGFDEKERALKWNFKNTEILKKHGILWMKGILKTRKFLKTRNFMDERNFKNTEILKNTEFYNVEFENGRGF